MTHNIKNRQCGSTLYYEWSPSTRLKKELRLQGFLPKEEYYSQEFVDKNWIWRRLYSPYWINPGTAIIWNSSPRWLSIIRFIWIYFYCCFSYWELIHDFVCNYINWWIIGYFTPNGSFEQ